MPVLPIKPVGTLNIYGCFEISGNSNPIGVFSKWNGNSMNSANSGEIQGI